jgi:hypothetical protein
VGGLERTRSAYFPPRHGHSARCVGSFHCVMRKQGFGQRATFRGFLRLYVLPCCVVGARCLRFLAWPTIYNHTSLPFRMFSWAPRPIYIVRAERYPQNRAASTSIYQCNYLVFWIHLCDAYTLKTCVSDDLNAESDRRNFAISSAS